MPISTSIAFAKLLYSHFRAYWGPSVLPVLHCLVHMGCRTSLFSGVAERKGRDEGGRKEGMEFRAAEIRGR